MDQVATMEQVADSELHEQNRPLVFLDTNVIMGYLDGDPASATLFSAEEAGRIRFASNPIVLQELLLADADGQPQFERLWDHLRVLPLNLSKAEALLPRVRALKDRLAHPNEILIASGADECDFLVTSNPRLKDLVTAGKPQVVTTEELMTRLGSA